MFIQFILFSLFSLFEVDAVNRLQYHAPYDRRKGTKKLGITLVSFLTVFFIHQEKKWM
jgi:hypothetical protein